MCRVPALAFHPPGVISYNRTQNREGRSLEAEGAMQKGSLGSQAELQNLPLGGWRGCRSNKEKRTDRDRSGRLAPRKSGAGAG